MLFFLVCQGKVALCGKSGNGAVPIPLLDRVADAN